MTRRIPVVSTLLVLAAVATMVALGFWQFGRLQEKETLLARYARAETLSAAVPFPRGPDEIEAALYRHSSLTCSRVLSRRTTAGQGARGESGVAQMATCETSEAGVVEIALGLSPDPREVPWSGGPVEGVVANAGTGKARLVAGKPPAGLLPLAQPDPTNIPNNHLSYAVQWFLFAATALVIYGLALKRRWQGK